MALGAAALIAAGQALWAAPPGAAATPPPPAWVMTTVPGTAGLVDPVAVAVDGAGDLYVADAGNGTVEELAAGTTDLVRLAGTGTPGFGGDGGPATGAQLDDPTGLAVDGAGDVYIADRGNDRIREVSAASHDISTVAGGGGFGSSPDGTPAAGAALEAPSGVAVSSSGQVFFTETSANRIRAVSPTSGDLLTVAGTGSYGTAGGGGPAVSAQLAGPDQLTSDASGDLFVTEPGAYDVREISAAGVISTVAGSGTEGDAGDNGAASAAALNRPLGVAVDSAGDVFLSEPDGERVREVAATTGVIYGVAGTGQPGSAGDGGPALSAQLHDPEGLATDSAGDVFVADTANHSIREFRPPAPGGCAGSLPSGTVSAIVGGPGDGGYRLASAVGAVAGFGSAACEGS
ncbi:MAG: NHL repeat-containing protein, partial [Acidimicrobiales bacterium]